ADHGTKRLQGGGKKVLEVHRAALHLCLSKHKTNGYMFLLPDHFLRIFNILLRTQLAFCFFHFSSIAALK
uniref:Uncharacterized protein n=1 Tax=Ciona intestinalis TaxID=7719 RepID=H2XLH2_CIOIN